MMRPRLGTDLGALVAIGLGAAVSLVVTGRLMTEGRSAHIYHEVEHYHAEQVDHAEHGDHEHEHEFEVIVSPHLNLGRKVVIQRGTMREIMMAGPEGGHSGWQGPGVRVIVPVFGVREESRIRVQRREREERRR